MKYVVNLTSNGATCRRYKFCFSLSVLIRSPNWLFIVLILTCQILANIRKEKKLIAKENSNVQNLQSLQSG